MSRMIVDTGPFMWPLLLLMLAVVVTTARRARELGNDAAPGSPSYEQRIGSLLFWGVLAALVGLLGQYSGIYMSITAALSMDSFNPALVAKGAAESIGATIIGFAILIVACVSWFSLRTLNRRRQAAP